MGKLCYYVHQYRDQMLDSRSAFMSWRVAVGSSMLCLLHSGTQTGDPQLSSGLHQLPHLYPSLSGREMTCPPCGKAMTRTAHVHF